MGRKIKGGSGEGGGGGGAGLHAQLTIFNKIASFTVSKSVVGCITGTENLPQEDTKGPDITLTRVPIGVERLGCGPLDWDWSIPIAQL